MRCFTIRIAATLLIFAASLSAAVIGLNTDPFAGSTALTTPGRQIVGGEIFKTFNIATDAFSFDPAVFNAGNTVQFANDVVGSLPTGGVNIIVLRTFDNDNNAITPFGAGNAANLIANQITTPGAGFFIYFNSGLNLPRLVYSTDLDDPTADLKILVRLTNLTGQPGRDAMETFTAANFNFDAVPEPSTFALMSLAGIAFAARFIGRRRRNIR